MHADRGVTSYFNPMGLMFRKKSTRDHVNENERGGSNLVIDVNDNFAKYGKKRLKRKNRTWLGSNMLAFIACSAFSFMFGFFWVLNSYQLSSSSDLHLRHQNTLFVNPRGPTQPKRSIFNEFINAKTSYEGGNNQNNIPILLSRFDNRSYMKAWGKNVNSFALELHLKKYPQTFSLKGWNYPAGFRVFPWVAQVHGGINNSTPLITTADYGDIHYHPIEEGEDFAREIPDDNDDFITPGGFDAFFIQPDGEGKSQHKRRNRHKKSPHPRESVSILGSLRHDATFDELRTYYDDDGVTMQRKLNDGTKKARACQRQSVTSMYFPTCNAFHEFDLSRPFDDPKEYIVPRPENSQVTVRYLSHGYYRDVWTLEENSWLWPIHLEPEEESPDQKFEVLDEERTARLVRNAYRTSVLKTFRTDREINEDNWEMIQIEAIIMERLTKSPRIMNIYGHCGFSVTAEVVPIEFEEVVVDHGGDGMYSQKKVEKRNQDGIRPYNDFTPTEKLEFALEMAESLADLHGFEDGVIVHDDVQLCQWLHTTDGRLKLGDFNRATIMQWDVENEEYCKFNNGEAYGNYRSPEEFAIKNLDEKIDVFSFGNNIYALLTGLWNFYDVDDDGEVHTMLIDQKLAYVDPRFKKRSYAEKKLVELMEKCWIYNPDDRISIFEAVEFLRNVLKENAALNNTTKINTS
mmetsp:Transcript_2823/g.5888  ORF Transcript_2823/g.5888 Transcript_2823/m.5888 type:complete len:687 (-) Transcript_2823:20-2080(-)